VAGRALGGQQPPGLCRPEHHTAVEHPAAGAEDAADPVHPPREPQAGSRLQAHALGGQLADQQLVLPRLGPPTGHQRDALRKSGLHAHHQRIGVPGLVQGADHQRRERLAELLGQCLHLLRREPRGKRRGRTPLVEHHVEAVDIDRAGDLLAQVERDRTHRRVECHADGDAENRHRAAQRCTQEVAQEDHPSASTARRRRLTVCRPVRW
jgi:hypothetical protein